MFALLTDEQSCRVGMKISLLKIYESTQKFIKIQKKALKKKKKGSEEAATEATGAEDQGVKIMDQMLS